jgi:hypothetical protein
VTQIEFSGPGNPLIARYGFVVILASATQQFEPSVCLNDDFYIVMVVLNPFSFAP